MCWWVNCCALVAFGLGAISLRPETASAVEPPSAADAPLKVSIAVPLVDGVRPIIATGPASHFHVVLENLSQKPVRIWRAGNSRSHAALHFELTDTAGKTRAIRRRAVPFLQNAPVWQELSPGDMLVIDVYFAGDEWEAFPLPAKGKQATIKLRAIYSVAPDQAAQKHGVWTGSVSSPLVTYRFENHR
jgi:hypothetical protein